MNTIPTEIKKGAQVLRALNHELRFRMLNEIRTNNNNLNVTDLYTKLKLGQSVVSQQLGILRKAGVVKTKRNGKSINYSVNETAILRLRDLANQITNNKN